MAQVSTVLANAVPDRSAMGRKRVAADGLNHGLVRKHALRAGSEHRTADSSRVDPLEFPIKTGSREDYDEDNRAPSRSIPTRSISNSPSAADISLRIAGSCWSPVTNMITAGPAPEIAAAMPRARSRSMSA